MNTSEDAQSAAATPMIPHRLILAIMAFQQKNGYIFSAWGKLRLPEHHVLIEIDRGPLQRPTDLSERLNIPVAQLTRILHSLSKRNLLKHLDADSDREKFLLLTKEGKELSSELDDISNQLMNQLARTLNEEEQPYLYSLWEELNNALDAPRTVAKPGDHPLRLQTRRFTRVFGYFASKSPELNFSFPEISTLYQLHTHTEGIGLEQLSQSMLVSSSNLRKLLTKLHEKELCTTPSSKKDLPVKLTTTGSIVFEQIVQFFANFIEKKLSTEVHKEMTKAVPIFEKALKGWLPVYKVKDRELYHYVTPDYFTKLQTLTLCEYTQRELGILQEPLSTMKDLSTKLFTVFKGPTPCFALRYILDESTANITLLEYGHSEQADINICLQKFHQYLSELSESKLEPNIQTTIFTSPLKKMLSSSQV